MNGTMTIAEAKQAFSTLPEKLSKRKRALAVTRGGKRVLAVMTWEQYEALTETRQITSDPEIMRAIREGEREVAQGRTIPLSEIKRRHGL